MNMMDNKNFIIAIVLSLAILIGWQYFFAPTPPPPQPVAEAPVTPGGTATPTAPGQPPATVDGGVTPPPGGTEASGLTRDAALALSPRVRISTTIVWRV